MSQEQRLSTNVSGDFYVTNSCINCDTCRQIAPQTYTEASGYSAVAHQPQTEAERRSAIHALLSCPTGAIHCENADMKKEIQASIGDFPLQVEDGIYYSGFTSHKSYGGSSYFLQHPDGNWLIDAPRFLPALVKKYEELGGIDTIFLTHRDDVADADKYAAHFGAKRIIHVLEKSAQPGAEHFLEGSDIIEWAPDFRIIPTPGHTEGHIVLHYKNRYLFTGDHLGWNHVTGELNPHERHCWYSAKEQAESMALLAEQDFEWILSGHGGRVHLPQEEMKRRVRELAERMLVRAGN
jgi:glyoxylase-like metal-dependent hydrolase (beta-lactamase superfamily II)/ferredoxin